MEKLFYSVFNLEEVNLKLKFSTIHQNCQYPAGYPDSGKQAAGYPAGYPDLARMEKLFYSVFNLEEINLKLKFLTIHQNCQYPAGYPESGKQSAGYPDPADRRISGIRWRDQILIRRPNFRSGTTLIIMLWL